MTTIDQRILIPAPPDVVWGYVSNIENFPNWQVACESVTFLSQKRQGVGTRWRERTETRQEHVYEVTSWYDGLGYEYVFIDGGGYQSSRGRIRVQEIPEGTIVQWTFTYELGGMLSGLRNALTTQRRVEGDMVDSLKTLWKLSRRQGSLEGYQSRALMQDGLQDPEERARYQSRHAPKTAPTSEQPAVPIEEPPLSEEDTRPRPSLARGDTVDDTPAAVPERDDARYAAPPLGEQETPAPPAPPQETADMPETSGSEEDHWRYAPPAEKPTSVDEPTSSPAQQSESVTPPAAPPEEPPASQQPAPSTAPSHQSLQSPPTSGDAPEPAEDDEDFKPKVSPEADTSEMSIWEVFGIPSPTDTQKMRAIRAAEAAEREYEAEEAAMAAKDEAATLPSRQHTVPDTSIGREGLRVSKRRGLIRVRRPGK